MANEKNGTVVLDSSDLAGQIAYATGEPRPAPAESKPAAEAKEEAAPAVEKPLTDAEWEAQLDEHGVHPSEKDGLTQKMIKSLGKRSAMIKAERVVAERQIAAERERAAKAERELAELRAKQAPAPEQKTPEDLEPVYKEGEDANDYWRRRDAWNRRQAIKEFRAEEAKRKEAEEAVAVQRSIDERLEAAGKARPDFREAALGTFKEPFAEHIQRYLADSPLMGEILYHLAKNPQEWAQVKTASPDRALVALAKIEGKLSPFALNGAKVPSHGGEPSKKEVDDEPSSSKGESSSQDTHGGQPSIPQPRASSAPIIEPVPSESAPQVATSADSRTARQELNTWTKKNPGVNLLARKRH